MKKAIKGAESAKTKTSMKPQITQRSKVHEITLQRKEGQVTQLMQGLITRNTAAREKFEHAKREKSKGT